MIAGTLIKYCDTSSFMVGRQTGNDGCASHFAHFPAVGVVQRNNRDCCALPYTIRAMKQPVSLNRDARLQQTGHLNNQEHYRAVSLHCDTPDVTGITLLLPVGDQALVFSDSAADAQNATVTAYLPDTRPLNS
jgi:hypothetical protein